MGNNGTLIVYLAAGVNRVGWSVRAGPDETTIRTCVPGASAVPGVIVIPAVLVKRNTVPELCGLDSSDVDSSTRQAARRADSAFAGVCPDTVGAG